MIAADLDESGLHVSKQERVIVARRFSAPVPAPAKDGPRVNEEITARTILLIGGDGHKFGEIGTEDARAIAVADQG